MTTAPLYKLAAWKSANGDDIARARFAEAMAALNYPASIWDRRSWFEGDRQRSTFLRRGEDTNRRVRVWCLMRADGVPSYPEIARACGMPSHSTIVMAVNRRNMVVAGRSA